MEAVPLSGAQYTLRAEDYSATIASVGATLRELRHRNRHLIAGFDADEVRPAMRGALLAPWPNRTADGRFDFHGATHQLVVNEPQTGNAAHGLIAWMGFLPTSIQPDRLSLAATLEPQPGYPWRLRFDVEFSLSDQGLDQEVVIENQSDVPAPVGLGGHPYLVAPGAGARRADSWQLAFDAEQVLLTSPDRLLPTGLVEVSTHDGGAFDFAVGRPLRDTQINHAFTGLRRESDGVTRVRVSDADGVGAEVSWDARCPWVQVYTADASEGDNYRHAVAVEPMTCPPDALNSGRDLEIVLPGETITAGWRIRACT